MRDIISFFYYWTNANLNSIPFGIGRERARRSRQRIVSSVVGFGFLGSKALLRIFTLIRSINVAGSRCTRNLLFWGRILVEISRDAFLAEI